MSCKGEPKLPTQRIENGGSLRVAPLFHPPEIKMFRLTQVKVKYIGY